MKCLKLVLAFTISLLLIASCGSNKKQAEEASDTFSLEDYLNAAEAIEPDLEEIDQIFNILDMVHAEYYDVLTNDPYSSHLYKNSYPVAAANLGIYMTDIVYHLYGDANKSMFITFQAAQELAKYIGVESDFASWTMENLEGTMMKRDTITVLFNNLLKDSKNYTSEKELVFVHTAFLTGSFVEKVYISSSLLKQKMDDEDITKEEEGDIRKLMIIYLNQLYPSTKILFEAFEKQQDQLSGLALLTTFETLEKLSAQLQQTKSALSVAPLGELTRNNDLLTSFDLISTLRSTMVSANQ